MGNYCLRDRRYIFMLFIGITQSDKGMKLQMQVVAKSTQFTGSNYVSVESAIKTIKLILEKIMNLLFLIY